MRRIIAITLVGALGVGVPALARNTPDPWPSADTTLTIPTASAVAAGDTAQATSPAAKSKENGKPKKSKSKGKSMTAAGTMPVKPAMAPAHVEVQHILIGFSGSVPGKNITRTKEEAYQLAHEILEKARKGANFDSLVAKYTDDSPPGIYKMSGDGVPPLLGEYGRRQMVPAFGNVGFAISPGNIDIAEYDPSSSPFGWHIIKRLR
ncbi:MAG TPA: peptidylprolyl isomerase [Candidatus Eisenbacteria bacterium]